MRFLARLFGASPEQVRKACFDIYEHAKRMRPAKPERDYLKIVLLTKPPFDYQTNQLVEGILDTCPTIESLADHIARLADPDTRKDYVWLWEARERNLKHLKHVKHRNEVFFEEFWGQ